MNRLFAKYSLLAFSAILFYASISFINSYMVLAKDGSTPNGFYIYLIIMGIGAFGSGFAISKLDKSLKIK